MGSGCTAKPARPLAGMLPVEGPPSPGPAQPGDLDGTSRRRTPGAEQPPTGRPRARRPAVDKSGSAPPAGGPAAIGANAGSGRDAGAVAGSTPDPPRAGQASRLYPGGVPDAPECADGLCRGRATQNPVERAPSWRGRGPSFRTRMLPSRQLRPRCFRRTATCRAGAPDRVPRWFKRPTPVPCEIGPAREPARGARPAWRHRDRAERPPPSGPRRSWLPKRGDQGRVDRETTCGSRAGAASPEAMGGRGRPGRRRQDGAALGLGHDAAGS